MQQKHNVKVKRHMKMLVTKSSNLLALPMHPLLLLLHKQSHNQVNQLDRALMQA